MNKKKILNKEFNMSFNGLLLALVFYIVGLSIVIRNLMDYKLSMVIGNCFGLGLLSTGLFLIGVYIGQHQKRL